MQTNSRSLVLLQLCGAMVWASAEIQVGKGLSVTDIQSAINSCPTNGCRIVLVDTAYELPRELWIEQKSDFVLRRSDALRDQGLRPRLHFATGFDPVGFRGTGASPDDPSHPAGWMKWPASPASSGYDINSPYAKTGYTYGGMVVVERSKDVLLEGLRLDGGRPTTFVNPAAFTNLIDLVHGNVGVNLHTSLRVRVVGADISGFFTGIQVYGNNPFGANAEDPFMSCYTPPPALGFPDTVGLHVLERNSLHGNIWAMRALDEKDLGSTARFNLAWDNRNQDWAALMAASPNSGSQHAGGFFLSTTYSVVPWRIHNNTIWGSPLAIGTDGYGGGRMHLFYGNLFGGFGRVPAGSLREAVSGYLQALSSYPEWMDHDLFVFGGVDSLIANRPRSRDQIRDSSACKAAGAESTGCWVEWDHPADLPVLQRWLWSGWNPEWASGYEGTYNGSPYWVADSNATTQSIPGGGRIASIDRLSRKFDAQPLSLAWARQLDWKSQSDLQPDWAAPSAAHFLRGKGSPFSGWDSADVGAVQKGRDSVRVDGWRSWEHVWTADRRCFALPLRPQGGVRPGGAKIVGLQVWSIASVGDWKKSSTLEYPVPMSIASISDSSIEGGEGSVLRVCLDSTLPRGVGYGASFPMVRFLVKSTVELPQGKGVLGLESTDFVWRDSLQLLRNNYRPVGTSPRRLGPEAVRSDSRGWRIPVNSRALVEARLVGIDGRTIWSAKVAPKDGTLWIPRPAIRRIMFLQIRTESGNFEAVLPGMPGGARQPVALRAACG